MRFAVRPLRYRGRILPWREVINRPALVGDLRIEECRDEDHPHRCVVEKHERGKRRERCHADEVGDDHETPPVEPVGRNPGNEAEDDERDEDDCANVAGLRRRLRDRERENGDDFASGPQ